jgi:hypothetical protein
MLVEKVNNTRYQWLMPVILAIQEVENERGMV